MTEFLTTLTEHGVLLTNVILIGVSAWLAHVTAVVARHDAAAMGKMSRDSNRTLLGVVRAFLSRTPATPPEESKDSGKR